MQGPPNTRRLRFTESRSTACGVRDQGSEIFVVYIGLETQTSRFQNSRVQGLGVSDLSLISGEGRRALRRIRIAPVIRPFPNALLSGTNILHARRGICDL